jgi:hypothetical protein
MTEFKVGDLVSADCNNVITHHSVTKVTLDDGSKWSSDGYRINGPYSRLMTRDQASKLVARRLAHRISIVCCPALDKARAPLMRDARSRAYEATIDDVRKFRQAVADCLPDLDRAIAEAEAIEREGLAESPPA